MFPQPSLCVPVVSYLRVVSIFLASNYRPLLTVHTGRDENGRSNCSGSLGTGTLILVLSSECLWFYADQRTEIPEEGSDLFCFYTI